MREADTVRAILAKHGFDLDQPSDVSTALESGGACYDDLYTYYAVELGIMPYGVQKARTATPDEWMFERIGGLSCAMPT